MKDDDAMLLIIFRLGILIVIGMVVQLGVIAYVIYSNYQGRQALVKSQRAGCARELLDRSANAQGWRIAQVARLQDGQIVVAQRYGAISLGFEKRSRIDCKDVYPDAQLFPW